VPNSTGGYQTTDREGRMIYQPYRPGVQYTTEGYRYELAGSSNNNNRSVEGNNVPYHPYRPGIQYTTEGYRYELGSSSNNYHVPVEGDSTYKYCTVDGYDQNSHNDSTQVGLIEPTHSEIVNNGYYHGNGYVLPVDTSKTTFTRRVYNKVKVGIKNHIAKSNDD
jgi:hypothetical protein